MGKLRTYIRIISNTLTMHMFLLDVNRLISSKMRYQNLEWLFLIKLFHILVVVVQPCTFYHNLSKEELVWSLGGKNNGAGHLSCKRN